MNDRIEPLTQLAIIENYRPKPFSVELAARTKYVRTEFFGDRPKAGGSRSYDITSHLISIENMAAELAKDAADKGLADRDRTCQSYF